MTVLGYFSRTIVKFNIKMTKVLIPTDFSEDSLTHLETLIQKNQEGHFEYVLIFSEHLDDSITELLFYSPSKFLESKMPKSFKIGFGQITEKYKQNCNINLLPFHGFTSSAFENFVVGNGITNYLIPQNLEYKIGLNPIKFINKCKLIKTI